MNLRPELLPPIPDEALVKRLAELADHLDSAEPGHDAELAEFNRLAGTDIPFEHFQGISGGEEHETWARRLLVAKLVRPVPDVTRAELVEVVRRAMPQSGYPDYEGYMAVFDANVSRAKASNLIFYPPDYDPATNTWGDGRPMGEYDPTPEQIVEWALG